MLWFYTPFETDVFHVKYYVINLLTILFATNVKYMKNKINQPQTKYEETRILGSSL